MPGIKANAYFKSEDNQNAHFDSESQNRPSYLNFFARTDLNLASESDNEAMMSCNYY